MNCYYDLEINILSCILQNPQLIENCKLKEEHFVKHKRFWLFLNAFYQKFKTFDLVLMYKVVKDKYNYVEYASWLMEVEPVISNFEKYQDELINLFEENKREKVIISRIFNLANDLFVGNIELEKFKNEVYKILGSEEK